MSAHVISLYPVEGIRGARLRYRLVEVCGAHGWEGDDGDHVEKNLNQLLKQVAIRQKAPVALVTRDEKRLLAVPADMEMTELDYALTPHVVTLNPHDETHEIDFSRLDDETGRIGDSFLAYHLRSPLMTDGSLWRAGPSMYFAKKPVNWKIDARDVDVFRGFAFRLVWRGKELYLGLRVAHKYVDSAWLVDRCDGRTLDSYRMRHFLYFFGNRWYPVQLLGYTGSGIQNAKFQPEPGGPIRNVHEYTLEKAGANPPNWIKTLNADSPGIQYRYPGKDGRFYGAAALCKLLLNTEDPAMRRAHRLSIMEPEERFGLMRELVERHFSKSVFGGAQIAVRPAALRVPPQTFAVPRQVFGRDKVLAVRSQEDPNGIELRDLGRARMSMLLDPEGGLAVAKSFDAQHLLAPEGLHRQITEDFKERIQKTVRQMTQMSFALNPVLFKADGRTLREQVLVVTSAVDNSGISHGHGIMILPRAAKKDLHNFIKRKFLDRLPLQCVSEEELHGFYALSTDNGRVQYRVKPELESRYVSYLRYTALGVLIANRQWPWVLEKRTHYDLYIGIDVLYNTAAFTFFADGGRLCFVRTYESKQKEKLSRSQIKTAIYENLKEMLASGSFRPRSIIVHRDGKTYHCEWKGFLDAVEDLKAEGRLSNDVKVGIIEIHKHSSLRARLVLENNGRLSNPQVGSWFTLSDIEGFVCTTGYPFRIPGTVNPLSVLIAHGELDIENVLRDLFWMSQLCWMVPDRCIRLPIDVKLCDDVLRSVAGYADEDEAYYGEDRETEFAQDDSTYSQSEGVQ